MIRSPVVAGRFYAGTASSLRADIDRLVDRQAKRTRAIGVVSPHAGYPFSGPVAGATLSRIEPTPSVIIMGPNHTGMGAPFSIMTEGTWKTPLGQVQIDSALANDILDRSASLEEDTAAHEYEHSIEVQIPFLQYFNDSVTIVPIVLAPGPGNVYKEIGHSIADAVSAHREAVLIMASSDMTHYEPQERAEQKDAKAIEAIFALDEDELLARVKSMGISMCGYAPTTSLIAAAKRLGATQAELVKYQTSGDTTGDYSRVVGYAGVIIK